MYVYFLHCVSSETIMCMKLCYTEYAMMLYCVCSDVTLYTVYVVILYWVCSYVMMCMQWYCIVYDDLLYSVYSDVELHMYWCCTVYVGMLKYVCSDVVLCMLKYRVFQKRVPTFVLLISRLPKHFERCFCTAQPL